MYNRENEAEVIPIDAERTSTNLLERLCDHNEISGRITGDHQNENRIQSWKLVCCVPKYDCCMVNAGEKWTGYRNFR